MGEVYRARDTRLERDVALKILPPSLASDPDRLRRLEQEARSASQINHPNVVAIYDVTSVNGATCIVSELLEGETLGQRMTRGKIPIAQVIRYAIQIAEGLAAAHARGVVHRDLKPENIFITTDDRAKILDFGLAKSLEPARSDALTATRATLPGVVFGTVGYMAPEQVRGGSVDQRSDIFSFGAVLFEMLSGRRAFDRSSAAETMAAILNEEPPDLSEARIPRSLLGVLRRCLAKNPEARYQSARDLAFNLEQLSSAAPSRLSLLPRRSVLYVSAAALVAALVAAGLWYSAARPARSGSTGGRVASIAVLPFENLTKEESDEYFSDGITEELINVLARVKDLRVVSRTSSFAFKNENADARLIAGKLGVEHLLEGSVRRTGSRLRVTAQLINGRSGYQVWSDRYDRELSDVFDIQQEIAESIAKRLSSSGLAGRVQLASRRPRDLEAYDLYLRGRHFLVKGPPTDVRKAIGYFEQAIKRDPQYAAAYSGLADGYALLDDGRAMDRDEAYSKAIAAARKALELDPALEEAHTSLGHILFHQQDYAGAENELLRALELNPNSAQAHLWYSNVLMGGFGRFAEAVHESEVALRLEPLAPRYSRQLGARLIYVRRYEEAVAHLLKSLELDPDNSLSHFWLATAYSLLGQHQNAIVSAKRAYDSSGDPAFRAGLASAYARAGEQDEALKILSDLTTGPPQQQLVASESIASAYTSLGNRDKALEWLTKAFRSKRLSGYYLVKGAPWFEPLQSDPRFAALLEQFAPNQKASR